MTIEYYTCGGVCLNDGVCEGTSCNCASTGYYGELCESACPLAVSVPTLDVDNSGITGGDTLHLEFNSDLKYANTSISFVGGVESVCDNVEGNDDFVYSVTDCTTKYVGMYACMCMSVSGV